MWNLWMFLCHVIFDQLTESERLLRSEQKRWTEVSLWMFLCHVIFDQLTESERLLRSEQKRWTEVWLWCSFGESADRVGTFASKWAKEVNRSLMNVPLPCDLRSADRVGTFASKWAKEVNRSLIIMFLCHVIFDQLTESERLLRSEQKRWTEVSW